MLLLGSMVTAARVLRAQQKPITVIGFLSSGSSGRFSAFVTAFHQGLSEAGYLTGQNVTAEYRWAEGRYDRLPALAAELVDRQVDLIVASSDLPAARAAKSATSTIPIVFTGVSNPVGDGLVASLGRPGGNVTGFSILVGELVPKRIEPISELVPQAKVIALLLNPNNSDTDRIISGVGEAARAKRVELPVLKAGTENEIETAFASLVAATRLRARRPGRSVLWQPGRKTRGPGRPLCHSGDI
jgi:putative tryptophan/tyrosine transport system substrate-binding protein